MDLLAVEVEVRKEVLRGAMVMAIMRSKSDPADGTAWAISK
jgi:hypothetical protein